MDIYRDIAIHSPLPARRGGEGGEIAGAEGVAGGHLVGGCAEVVRDINNVLNLNIFACHIKVHKSQRNDIVF
jgi:hypothetical protein